jgi:hypothetical protein
MPAARPSAGARRRQYHAVHTALAFHLGVIRPGPNFHRTSAMNAQTKPAFPTEYAVWGALVASHGSPKRESEVSAGFWRRESGKGYATPVATWFDEGLAFAQIGEQDAIDPDCGDEWLRFASETWPKLSALSEDDYRQAMETGAWPDGVPVRLAPPQNREAIGGNNPPEGTVEALLAEAQDAVEKAAVLVRAGAAKTQKDADIAANVAKTLTETKAKIIAAHKVEKEPWLQGGRDVDAKFFPLRDSLEDTAKALKSKVNLPFLQEQKRLADEAEAKAKREAAEAAAAGREPDAPAAEPVKVTSGSKGRKVSLVERKYGEITDHEAFAGWLGKTKSPVIMAALESAAGALARNPVYAAGDTPCPGLIVRSRQEAV